MLGAGVTWVSKLDFCLKKPSTCEDKTNEIIIPDNN